MSSLIPMKKTMIEPAMIYLSSKWKKSPAKITVERTNPMNIAIPPRFGVTAICEVRPLGSEQRFFIRAIVTIEGMVYQVMANAIKKPRTSNVQTGRKREVMFKDEFTIQVN